MSHLIQTSFLTGIRQLFYAVTPNETSFERIEDVPNYTSQVLPFFVLSIVLEVIGAFMTGHKVVRINDGISSVGAGIFSQLPNCLIHPSGLAVYTWVYNNYRITSLPWNSQYTWLLCFLGVDFAYYWFHRFAHEVNILWALHQPHHSSEDYNLTTALRQPLLQKFAIWFMYLPMALAIPPSIYIVHTEFNLLFQFWIHTEVIKSIGPLEYLINTPSHHRVHHGRNPYCIDTNYGGTLIIWDRIFGTFQPEHEKVVYGLTHPLNTWDQLDIQFAHLKYMWTQFWQLEGVGNKLSLIFKGPGWLPGKPRLGNPEDIPKIESPVVIYDQKPNPWLSAYTLLHFLILIVAYQEFAIMHKVLPMLYIFVYLGFFVFSLVSVGALSDCKWYAPGLEVLRCLLFLVTNQYILSESKGVSLPMFNLPLVAAVFLLSTLLNIGLIVKQFTTEKQKEQ